MQEIIFLTKYAFKICVLSYKMPCMVLNSSPVSRFLLAQLSVWLCCVFSDLIRSFFFFFTTIPQLPYTAVTYLTKFQLQTLRCEDDVLTIRRLNSFKHALTSHLRTRREISPAQRRRCGVNCFLERGKEHHVGEKMLP